MLLRRHVAETQTRFFKPDRIKAARVVSDPKAKADADRVSKQILSKLQWIQKIILEEQVSFHFSWSDVQNIIIDLESNLRSWSLWSLTKDLKLELFAEFHAAGVDAESTASASASAAASASASAASDDELFVYNLETLALLQVIGSACCCPASKWGIIQHCTKPVTCCCDHDNLLKVIQRSPEFIHGIFHKHPCQMLGVLLELCKM